MREFAVPRRWVYGVISSERGYEQTGFWLRRFASDHGAPAVRIPREVVRNLGWKKGDFLFVVPDGDMIVIGKLKYEDPKEVARDKANEVRRKLRVLGPADDLESGAGRDGDPSIDGDRGRRARDGEPRRGDAED